MGDGCTVNVIILSTKSWPSHWWGLGILRGLGIDLIMSGLPYELLWWSLVLLAETMPMWQRPVFCHFTFSFPYLPKLHNKRRFITSINISTYICILLFLSNWHLLLIMYNYTVNTVKEFVASSFCCSRLFMEDGTFWNCEDISHNHN